MPLIGRLMLEGFLDSIMTGCQRVSRGEGNTVYDGWIPAINTNLYIRTYVYSYYTSGSIGIHDASGGNLPPLVLTQTHSDERLRPAKMHVKT